MSVFSTVSPYVAPLLVFGLVVFVHPLTGNDLLDHRDRALWMGELRPLDLSMLDETPVTDDL